MQRATDALLGEGAAGARDAVSGAITALARAQLGRAEVAARRATLHRLWAGSDACGKVGAAPVRARVRARVSEPSPSP